MTRRERTRETIAAAAVELGERTALREVTVTALASRAGITRETFYQHFATVADAIAAGLASELQEIGERHRHLPAASGSADSVFRVPTEHVVEHFARRAAVYRNAMAPRLDPSLRALLVAAVAEGLLAHLDAHPEIAPVPDEPVPSGFARVGYAAYAAAGTVGVLEEWLASAEPVQAREVTAVILAAAPEWWQGRASPPGPGD